jgi:hypothetical protein
MKYVIRNFRFCLLITNLVVVANYRGRSRFPLIIDNTVNHNRYHNVVVGAIGLFIDNTVNL